MILQIEKIDIVTAAMGHALATEGGFCTGSARVIDHQVCKIIIYKNDHVNEVFYWLVGSLNQAKIVSIF